MSYKQTAKHRNGKGSFHQIGLVRGQFGNIPEAKWIPFIQDSGFDGWVMWHPGSQYEIFLPALEKTTVSRAKNPPKN